MKVKLYFATLERRMLSESDEDHYHPSLRVIEFERNGQNCGFHLTRGKWDPYPWVSGVEEGSVAHQAGIKAGDCLLEVNGNDVVGKRISEIADTVKLKSEKISLLVWNAGIDPQCSPETLCCGPITTNLQRLSACMSSILAFLECPVCLDTISPPTYQCDNGHLICLRCRTKTEKCPVCRLRFTRGRSLLSNKVYSAFIEAFNLREETDEARSQKIQQIFKNKNKNKNVPDIKITHSHTNKLLSKLPGKSSSVDNLSNSKYLLPDMPIQNNTNLKVKSLSTNEIFVSNSPAMSRAGSVNRLNLHSASCHSSFESLQNKREESAGLRSDCLKIENDSNDEQTTFFNCPFNPDCLLKITEDNILKHFQINHDGPLVQYFNTSISIELKKLQEDEICYFLNSNNDNKFFLKTSKICSDELKSETNGVLLWVWYVGSDQNVKKFEINVEICDKSQNDLLLKIRAEVISLASLSFQEIIASQKGVYLSFNTLEALGWSNCLKLNVLECS